MKASAADRAEKELRDAVSAYMVSPPEKERDAMRRLKAARAQWDAIREGVLQ